MNISDYDLARFACGTADKETATRVERALGDPDVRSRLHGYQHQSDDPFTIEWDSTITFAFRSRLNLLLQTFYLSRKRHTEPDLSLRLSYSILERDAVPTFIVLRDLVTAFLAWPALSLLFLSGILWACGVSSHAMVSTIIYVVPFAIAGLSMCGSSITLLGSGAAGVVITVTFGLAYGLLIESGGIEALHRNLGSRTLQDLIIGGVPSLTKPTLLSVVCTTIGILITAYLMTVNSQPTTRRLTIGQLLRGLIVATSPGAVIGVIMVLGAATSSTYPEARDMLFAMEFAVLGSFIFAFAARRRIGSDGQPWRLLVTYSVHSWVWLMLVLLFVGVKLPQLRMGVIAAGHSMFHGTLFAASYLVGERIGGRALGGIACAVEGIGGYLGYMTTAPWSD